MEESSTENMNIQHLSLQDTSIRSEYLSYVWQQYEQITRLKEKLDGHIRFCQKHHASGISEDWDQKWKILSAYLTPAQTEAPANIKSEKTDCSTLDDGPPPTPPPASSNPGSTDIFLR